MSEPFGTNRRLAVPKGGSPCTVTESANHRELGFGTKGVRGWQTKRRSIALSKRQRCLLSTYFIEHDFPRGIELLQQVKVPNVAGQHRTSIFSSGGE